jgi:hypothetical protein
MGVDVRVVALDLDATPVFRLDFFLNATPVFRFRLLLDGSAASSRDAVMMTVAIVFAGSTLCT